MDNKIIIVRTCKCRKSDVIVRFLEENKIPHEVRYVESDPEAQRLFEKFNIKASPGIIINNESVNPYGLVEKCKVKDPQKTKQMFEELLAYGD